MDVVQQLPETLQGAWPQLAELAATWGVRVLSALIALVATWVISRWIRRAVTNGLSHTSLDGAVVGFMANAARWAALVVGFVLTLGLFGVQTTSLAAVLGGAGVGLGLALQGNLANVASGLVILAVRPFRNGDWVELAGKEGLVSAINLLTTQLETFDGRRIHIPNDQVFSGPIENRTELSHRRATIEVGVAYDTDLRHALEVLTRAAQDVQRESPDTRGAIARVTGFGASSVDIMVGAWCRTPDFFEVKHELYLKVFEALGDAGIEIPFPQVDLHLDDRLPRLRLSTAAEDEELAAR